MQQQQQQLQLRQSLLLQQHHSSSSSSSSMGWFAAACGVCAAVFRLPLVVDFAAAAAAAYGAESIRDRRPASYLLQQEFLDCSRPLTKRQEEQLALLQEEAAAGTSQTPINRETLHVAVGLHLQWFRV